MTKPPTRRKSVAAARKRAKRLNQPTMAQVRLEMDRGPLRSLRNRLEQTEMRQIDLEVTVQNDWDNNQTALHDLLHRVVALEKKA